MVEPSIAITAAAIATLRPIFAPFLTFTQKRFSNDSPTEVSSSCPSTESRNSKSSGEDYTADFAKILGLQRYGVTTHISAGKLPGWRERRRIAINEKRGRERSLEDTESQMELYVVQSEVGIKRTTVVMIEWWNLNINGTAGSNLELGMGWLGFGKTGCVKGTNEWMLVYIERDEVEWVSLHKYILSLYRGRKLSYSEIINRYISNPLTWRFGTDAKSVDPTHSTYHRTNFYK